MDTKISKTSKILFCLCLINSSILMLFLAFELVFDIVILTMIALDGADAPADTIGASIVLFLPAARFYTLFVLLAYRIKSIISPSQDLPAYKISFFTHRIVQGYLSPVPMYYFIILLNTICTIYFMIVFNFAQVDIPLWGSWFPLLLFCPVSIIAIFYDTQFMVRNVYYSFLLNILYFMAGLYMLNGTIQSLLIKYLIIITLSLVFFLCYIYHDKLIKLLQPR